MSANAKKLAKPFNVDYMRKKSVYVITKRTVDNLLIIETYLMQSKDGIFEHLVSIRPSEQIPTDIDRVVGVTGTGSWFSPVDSLIEVCSDVDSNETNFVGHKNPFTPAGIITVFQDVTFAKKVYAMEVQTRELKSQPRATKSNIDSIFERMVLAIQRPVTDKKKADKEKGQKEDKKK